MNPSQFPKGDVQWRQFVEQLCLQIDVDIKRLWKRAPQAWRGTDGNVLPQQFPLQQVLPPSLTGSDNTVPSGVTGTENTAGSLPSFGCPCGESLWIWSDSEESWGLLSSECGAGCNQVVPKTPGAYDGEKRLTCCEPSLSGTPDSGTMESDCSGSFSAILIRDSFTDDNGVAWSDHTPDINTPGNAWNADGRFTIQGNQGQYAEASGSQAPSAANIDAGVADGEVTCDVTIGDGNTFAGIRFRDNDEYTNGWFLQIHVSLGFRLFRVVNDTASLRDSASVSISTETAYALKASFCGPNIVCTLDGGNELQVMDSTHQTQTRVGILSGDGEESHPNRFDNFVFRG